METTRKILNTIFLIAVAIGLIWLLIMLLGGGFPVSLSTIEARIRFDVSKMGWKSNQPDNGLLTITHEKDKIKEGWGALQFDYKYNREKPPGVYTTNYGMEGLRNLKVWLKSKNPSIIGIRLKDKHKQYDFTYPVRVENKWRQISISHTDYKAAVGMKERLETTRFDGYLEFRDMTPHPSSKDNTLWIDTIEIYR